MRRLLTWKWRARGTVAVAALAVLSLVAYPVLARWLGGRALDRMIERLDRDDPGWRWEEIAREANAKLPPDDRNPLVVALAADGLLPVGIGNRPRSLPDWRKPPPYEPLDAAVGAKLAAAFVGLEPATEAALDLADLPAVGGEVVAPDMIRPVFPAPWFRLNPLANAIHGDALLRAEEGRGDAAVRAVRAAVATARAVGDEPSLVAQMVRNSRAVQAARLTERVLGLSEPDAGLSELQAELQREADAPRLLVGLRGERAHVLRYVEDIQSGPLPPGMTMTRLEEKVFRAALPADLALTLDLITRHVEAERLPPARRAAAHRAVPAAPVAKPMLGGRFEDPRYHVSEAFLSQFDTILAAMTRGQSELTTVAAGIACERYRRRFGQWPDTLDGIPKDILPAVPIDPCDGQPIRFKRMPDHVVVYSVGPDGVDDGGAVTTVAKANDQGLDFGIRLYDVAQRRRPAPATAPGAKP